MILFAILTLLSAYLIGVCKGICDELQFHYPSSVFARFNPLFWNPQESWKNKYTDYDADDLTDRFPFSRTWLVLFTDAWHLFQFFQNILIPTLAVLLAMTFEQFDITNPLYYFVIIILLRGVMQVGFYSFYRNPKSTKPTDVPTLS